jgi:hypothetical protein
MDERLDFFTLIVRTLQPVLTQYNSAKSTRLVESVESLRITLQDIVQEFDRLNVGTGNTSGRDEVIRTASAFIQSTVKLSEVASSTPLRSQLEALPAAVQAASSDSLAALMRLLQAVKPLKAEYDVLFSKKDLIAVTQAISASIADATIKLQSVVNMMALDDRQFDSQKFGDLMSGIGLIVKNQIITPLDPVKFAEVRAKLIQALTDVLLQAKSYKESRTVTARTLVSAAITNLLTTMATLVLH